MVDHWSLQKRIDHSDLVIEGRVVAQTSSWDAEQKNIYTINTIEVYRIFKGLWEQEQVQVVTLGGTIGTEKHVAQPALELDMSQTGVFLLALNRQIFNDYENLFQPERIPASATTSIVRFPSGQSRKSTF
jgi:hypothetical protein